MKPESKKFIVCSNNREVIKWSSIDCLYKVDHGPRGYAIVFLVNDREIEWNYSKRDSRDGVFKRIMEIIQ